MAKLGRPVEKYPKKSVTITLSPADVALARLLGRGNLSAGIHRALRIATGTEPVVSPGGRSRQFAAIAQKHGFEDTSQEDQEINLEQASLEIG